MTTVSYDTLKYNAVRAKASHNSYMRYEGLDDQFLYWRIRSMELDIHVGNDAAGWDELKHDWYVYHASVVQDSSSVTKLSDALKVLAGFNAAVPDHEVCTIAIDLKDDFDDDHTPQDLDDLIEKYLPGKVYKPSDFLGSNTNLQQSAGNWPLLKSLRGKFIFITTTGNLDSSTSHLNQYVSNGATANTRTCFVAPEITTQAQITQNDYAVFFNMTTGNARSLGPKVFAAGFMSRAYGNNSQSDWNNAIAGKNHLIGTDAVNSIEDTWSRTDNAKGWPFEGIDVSVDPDTKEKGTVLGIQVKSGDIWGKADSCAFWQFPLPSVDQVYRYAVSVPSSHAPDKWGKAGIMVRASNDADAANFCVVRPADNNNMRVQVRSKKGGDTSAWDLAPPSEDIGADTWMYVRLQVSNSGKRVEAWGSYDGDAWISIHAHTFDDVMDHHGLVGSSHDTSKSVKYLFVPLGGTATPDDAKAIGSNVTAKGFSGVYPPG